MENNSFDPSMNFLQSQKSVLDKLFNPKTIAVVGATETENSVGRTLMENLTKNNFGGVVIPVHPKRSTVMGIVAYKDVRDIPQAVDLVIIVTPAKTVPSIIQSCVEKNIPTAVIISAGFKEMGPPGIALEKQIMDIAKNKMRIIGPNCLGIMNPISGLNATFAADMARKGSVAFISQSGALCTAVLDWSLQEKVGFSSFISIGSMVDVDFADILNYLGKDPNTQSILIYMESVGNARAFLSAAREVSLSKPIILIKAGRTAESAKAAASHTGSLSGSDDVFSAALQRVGVLRVETIADLFAMAEVLGKQPRPKGPHLSIITNAGGPGVIATDALIEHGGALSEISPNSMQAYNQILPAPWSHNNPIDILGDASPDTYAKTLDIAIQDPNSDGILVILTPQDMTDPTVTAQYLEKFAKIDKPILASWIGGKRVEKGSLILSDAGIPTFSYPDMACKTFASMWNYSYHLKSIYEVSSLTTDVIADVKKVEEIIGTAKKENRTVLDEFESKKVLEAYKIPTVPTFVATSKEEAVKIAEKMQFPLVLKLYSKTITHKTDVGGVKLNLKDVDSVKVAFQEIFDSVKKIAGVEHFQGVTVQPMMKLEGYELILGSSFDPQFGPVLLFGTGGQLVEVFKDRALGLPPLTNTLAKKMMEQTKIYEALKGVRGRKSVNLEKLESILVQFSRLVAEQKWIKECDINPLLASPDHLIALDARIILHDGNLKESEIPTTAIRPYPLQYVENYKLKDGSDIILRPIRPEDEPDMVEFHKELSKETVRQRYLEFVHLNTRVAHDSLHQMCFIDYDREIAIIAKKGKEILGIVRISKVPGTSSAIFTITIKDSSQNKGLGSKFLEKIIKIAKLERIEKIQAQMLDENVFMQKLMKKYGFQMKKEGKLVKAEFYLSM